MERLSERQPLNRSVMEVDVVIEMQPVGRKEDQNFNEASNPPMIDRNDDDTEKILDAIETTPFVDSLHRTDGGVEKNFGDRLSFTEEQGVKKAFGEPLNWIFANNDMKRNYNLINDSSVIEFIPEQRENWDKVCSLIQIPKPITSCQRPMSFKMKIEDLGKNKVGDGNYGIELGFTKMLSDEESTLARGRRMKMGLWYDAFNGGIYNYKNYPKDFMDKTNSNNVVEWRVEDVEEEDGVVKTRATLLLNNKDTGKSFLLDGTKDIHPSIYIGSRGAKVTIDVSGMGYTPTVIEYPDATEEEVSLAPHMDFASYVHQYYKSGYLVYQEAGEAGKVCVDHMNKTVPKTEVGRVLNKLGESMCNTLEYRDLVSIEIMVDNEQEERDVRYVDMIGPMSDDKSFIDVPCESREVVRIECNHLECGRRPAHIKPESIARRVEGRSSALHGDWPWHVALYKNGLHVCDGTLMNERWIMTTASCFQGQGRSKWAARFASVRLNSRAPWEQKRQIVGMVKSPVEGNSIVILKMDKPVIFSDFARPICLPSSDEFIHMGAACVTLAWNNKDQQLHVVHLEPAPREKCEEVSEVSPHTICTQEKSERSECNGEEVAGAPLMCQAEGEWHLVGVAAWRKGCSSVGQRPRLYDKVSPNSEWAQKTIQQLDKEDETRKQKKEDRKRGRTPKQTKKKSMKN